MHDRVSCPSLVDAMGRVHDHRSHIVGLVSPAPRKLFGPAATIAHLPYRHDIPHTEFGDPFGHAAGDRPADTVLVLSSGGRPDVSHSGGTKLSRLERAMLRTCGSASDGMPRVTRRAYLPE
ncbi:hypothetical protein [Streptomyces sp. OE57]|uniref:hypothetical protein n=1 Tax=Streptomyces lacaronensis TaxID=3379885 RepID=UPI0039B79490